MKKICSALLVVAATVVPATSALAKAKTVKAKVTTTKAPAKPAAVAGVAQFPPLSKWMSNNGPGCTNVFPTATDLTLKIGECMDAEEQVMKPWVASTSPDGGGAGVKLAVPAGAGISIAITYRYSPVGNDVFVVDNVASYDTDQDSFTPIVPTADPSNPYVLPPSDVFTTAIVKVNFDRSGGAPLFTAPTAMTGVLHNFGLSVTDDDGNGRHVGSTAVIKSVVISVG